MIQNIALVLKKGDTGAQKAAKLLINSVIKHGLNAYISDDHKEEFETTAPFITDAEIREKIDLVFALGGDGTFLVAANKIYASEAQLIGINLGHLGFLTELEECSDFDTVIQNIKDGKIQAHKRPYLDVVVTRNSKEILSGHFLNDAVMHRSADNNMMSYNLCVADEFVTSGSGDGFIISSPTGSTAYNLSTGGPLVHPSLDVVILSPICPHNLSLKPIVIPPQTVGLRLTKGKATLFLDGKKQIELQIDDHIKVTKSKNYLRLFSQDKHSFFYLLNTKLGWGSPQ